MIDSKLIKSYVDDNDFNGAYKLIYKEYENLTKGYLQNHNIKVNGKGCLPDYCNKLIEKCPNQVVSANKIKNFMYEHEEDSIEKIQGFINTYEEIYKTLK